MVARLTPNVSQWGVVIALSAMVSICKAAPLAVEKFDYPNDLAVIAGRTGGVGWAEPWVDDDADFLNLTMDDVSLDSPVFPFAPAGDRVEGQGAGEASRLMNTAFDLTQEGATFYVSFLFNKTGSAATAGDNMEINVNSGSSQILRFGGGSTEQFFLGSSAVSFGTITLGSTYFMVLKGVASAAGPDQFFAKIYAETDAPPTAEPAVWDATFSGLTAAQGNSTLNTIRIVRGANAAGAFDEIRVGLTFADVTVPEPSSLVLLALAGLAVAAGRRRHGRPAPGRRIRLNYLSGDAL